MQYRISKGFSAFPVIPKNKREILVYSKEIANFALLNCANCTIIAYPYAEAVLPSRNTAVGRGKHR